MVSSRASVKSRAEMYTAEEMTFFDSLFLALAVTIPDLGLQQFYR